ncbi:hypothetical protein ACFE04_000841 [Oxalis oulophora]
MRAFPIVKLLLLALLLVGSIIQINCIEYKTFPDGIDSDFIRTNSYVTLGAIQVTPDVKGDTISNRSGRALYKKPFKLWREGGIKASFNSTFVLNISPQTVPGGEGLAFILAAETSLPENSHGQWLGIVNETTNNSPQAHIVAIEFDTRKSYEADNDSNHVGLDINSVYSIQQVSLASYGVNLSSSSDVTVNVRYDGENENLSVFVSMTDEIGLEPVLSQKIDLSAYLPKNVYVGFSASTSNYTQLNCVKSWSFHISEIGNTKLLWVWISVPVLALTLIVGIVCGLYFIRKSAREKSDDDAYGNIENQIRTSSLAPQRFKLKELKDATGGFSRQNKLGKGGFGPVYKGSWKNKEIAVKKVSKKSTQGKQEFIAEITTIGNLNHRNLVKLIGWCYERPEFLLVYEFMPKGSLEKYLFNPEESTLSWEKRLNIVTGVAQALEYLHNGCGKRVLHRDIKASNIMLDSDFIPKLGDFGLARTIEQNEKTHYSTKEIAGTPGYMAPESFLVGRATVEMDIYAFGVLILEVSCGRQNGSFNGMLQKSSVVDWLWELYRSDRLLDAADQKLEGGFVEEAMASVLLLGLACCHPNPHYRPSMKNVLQVLIGEVPAPLVPAEKPSFVWPAVPPSFKETDDSFLGGQLSNFTELSGR